MVTQSVIQETPTADRDEMRPFRCSRCGHFLLEECIVDGVVRIKCRYCKTVNEFAVRPDKSS